jgi:hypothetical protein
MKEVVFDTKIFCAPGYVVLYQNEMSNVYSID